MGKCYTITRNYPVSADVLWADILDFQALADSMEGQVSYSGLPTHEPEVGEAFTVKLKRWGWMPMGSWTMKIVERDDAAKILRSEEHGGPVRLYKHRLSVEPLDESSCRYTDNLDVDAGWLTPLIAPSFKSMYEKRHEARRARLARA